MRWRILAGLICALVVLTPQVASAQRPRLKIEQVKVGFLKNPQEGVFKAGAWCPVYIDITAPPEGLARADVVVESTDSDDVRNSYSLPLRSLEPSERVTVLSYCRPGSFSNKISVLVKVGNYAPFTHEETYMSIQLGQPLYLFVGSRGIGFRKAMVQANRRSEQSPGNEQQDENLLNDDSGPRRAAVVDAVQQLPTRWYGYECVDVVFLMTGSRDFVEALLNDQENRKEALAEWVRRGGRLVLSVGRNYDLVSQLGPALEAIMPAQIIGQLQLPALQGPKDWVTGAKPVQNRVSRDRSDAARPPVEVAKLELKPTRLVRTDLREQEGVPLVVRASYGLGRVTMVAFDLDSEPFLSWEGQRAFWDRLRLQEGREPRTESGQQRLPAMYYQGDGNEIAGSLLRGLEEFEDVPVISFGWVALFILIYILVVGPLDYFFLKKVVKRLELTWVTFPTVVILISVAAYFTAYHLKGNEQKINKLDVVDVDLQTQRVFGQTWFTIFSPRIQHYTIGLEPTQPSWAATSSDPNRAFSTVVTWVGRPDAGYGGTGRAGSQSLFRRTYEYELDAVALRGVPIQVWTTKSFVGSWEAPLDTQVPLFQANLSHPPKQPELISGTITSNLPVELQDVYLYHTRDGVAGQWYFLDRMQPNTPKRVDSILGKGGGQATNTWMNTYAQTDNRLPPQSGRRQLQSTLSSGLVVKQMMFNDADAAASNRRNNSVRFLDQSWRLRQPGELVLVGRLARQEGEAELISQAPATPTRLWLKGFPGQGKPREPLSGKMVQETWVRVFLPLRVVQSE